MLDKQEVITDLLSMHMWGSDFLPYEELVRMLKQESGSTSSLYDIAVYVNEVLK